MAKSHDVRRYPGLGLLTALFFVYLYLPIAAVIFFSFNENRLVSVWTGFSLKWYASALTNRNLLEAVKTRNAKAALLVNYSEFNTSLLEPLAKSQTKTVFYGPPQVWAWRQDRAKKIAAHVGHVAAVLPLEVDVWQRAGAKVTYVGHPALDQLESASGEPEPESEPTSEDTQRCLSADRHGFASRSPVIVPPSLTVLDDSVASPLSAPSDKLTAVMVPSGSFILADSPSRRSVPSGGSAIAA